MKRHHPDVFLCALLNSQPMGFYAPAQLVRDARAHGVAVRWADVNRSHWDCTLEPGDGRGHAVRLGLRMVRGLANRDAARIVAARGSQPYRSVEEIWKRAGVPVAALEKMARAAAFGSLGLERRDALWQGKALGEAPLPLFAAADRREGGARPELEEPAVVLAPMAEGRQVVDDYRSSGLALRAHPVSFVRADLDRIGSVPARDLRTMRAGRRVTVAGLVLVRQRPGSAKGVMFITL